MTILRLDLQAGGWRAVPPLLFEDKRLSLDTRAVAGFISTRSDTFRLSVSGLCVLLGLGEEKWRRMSRELESAGYLKRFEGKDERGRFRHELLFSPIPCGGFHESASEKTKAGRPKIQTSPYAVKPALVQPEAAEAGSTGNSVDLISELHHQPPAGGGENERANQKLPENWIEAAELEIDIEQQVRPIRNRGGLLKAILDRYRSNGGPNAAAMEALKAKKAADREREAQAEADRLRGRQAFERAQTEELRRTEAESKAAEMSIENRLVVLTTIEGTVAIRGNKRTRDAFIEHGKILPGPLYLTLVRTLMPAAP